MTDEEWVRLRYNDPQHNNSQGGCNCFTCQARRREYWEDPANVRKDLERQIQDKRNAIVWAQRDIEFLEKELARLVA